MRLVPVHGACPRGVGLQMCKARLHTVQMVSLQTCVRRVKEVAAEWSGFGFSVEFLQIFRHIESLLTAGEQREAVDLEQPLGRSSSQ